MTVVIITIIIMAVKSENSSPVRAELRKLQSEDKEELQMGAGVVVHQSH